MKRLLIAKSDRVTTKFWITRDRRITLDQIYKDLVEGNIYSIYFTADAAKAAGYPTEKVWEINISAIEVAA